ncbi:ThuA domain-containing protein, partial [Meiothermus sp. Pnk-1]|uniref:ThuA domain-containing protein n=2 Tax=unclassified Meiothermus TaxID=370471 RepID=UPI000D95EB05
IAYQLNGGPEQNISFTPGASVDFTATVSGLAPGSNTLIFNAYDAAGNKDSASTRVVYTGSSADTSKPSLSISSPANGSSTNRPNLNVQGQASDNVRVSRLTYQLNGGAEQNVGISPATSVNFSFSVGRLRPGNNTITLNAYDDANNKGSASLGVTYNPSPVGSLNFNRRVVDQNGPRDPWMKGIADLNGDGLPDLIVGGANGPVVWYAAPNWTKGTISSSASSQSGSAAADIDGDGDIDVVIGTTWYENQNQGASWTAHALGSAGTHDIVIADFNGDGKPDIAMRGEADAVVSVFFQNGKDSWSKIDLDPGYGRNGLDAGDLDRDGKPDLVIGGYWLKNPGGEGAKTASNWKRYKFADWDAFAAVRVADLNQDGRLDVVLSVSESLGDVAWFEAPADPTSLNWTKHLIDRNLDSVHSLDVVDMNQDGNLDVVGSEFRDQGRLIVYLNDGSGNNWTANVVGNDFLHNTRVADIGNDGDYDIFGATAFGDAPVTLYENTPSSTASNKVLVFSKTLGYRHGSIAQGIQAIKDLGAQNNFSVDATEDSSVFTASNLAQYKAVIFLNTSGDVLEASQKQAFQQYIEQGGGFVGVHNAADTMRGWAWYENLVGAMYQSEINTQPLTLRVISSHLSTQGLPSVWNFTDEAYNYDRDPKQGGATVLITFDDRNVSGGTMGADHPFSWYKAYDGGRSWYTVGGANPPDYENPYFLQHLLGGIRYAGNF